MEFSLTEEQKAIARLAREFALREFPLFSREADEREEFPRELVRRAARQGFVGLTIPKEYGGAGLGVMETVLATEAMNAVDPGLAICIFGADFGSEAIVRLGTPEQKERFLRGISTGDSLLGAAISEAGAGSDVASASTRAVLEGDEYVVDGSKMWITNGTVADHFVTLVQTHPEDPKPHRRFSLLVIPRTAPGFKAHKIRGKLGIRASDTAEIEFVGCRVPKENLLGEPQKGFYYVMEFFNNTRIGVAAQAVGIAQGAFEIAKKYAVERRAFGSPIAEFQAIQFKLAEMATRTEASRLLTYKAAWCVDRGRPDPLASSMAKWFAGEAAVRNSDEAVQILGGMGYVDEMPAEKFYRDAKITEIYEGTKEIHKLIIARALLGRIPGASPSGL